MAETIPAMPDFSGPKGGRRFLIVTTILFSLGGLAGILPAIISVFLFDAPGSEKNPATILLFVSALTFPVVCLVSIGAAWILHWRTHVRAARWVSLLPAINLLCGGAAMLYLEIFNGGRFS